MVDNTELLVGSYKAKKIGEVLELASVKARVSGSEGGDKVLSRSASCKSGLEDLSTKLDQVSRWLRNNPDCCDCDVYERKRKWIGKAVEGAFYAVDRALYEWRARRDRTGSVMEKAGGMGGRRGRRRRERWDDEQKDEGEEINKRRKGGGGGGIQVCLR